MQHTTTWEPKRPRAPPENNLSLKSCTNSNPTKEPWRSSRSKQLAGERITILHDLYERQAFELTNLIEKQKAELALVKNIMIEESISPKDSNSSNGSNSPKKSKWKPSLLKPAKDAIEDYDLTAWFKQRAPSTQPS